MNQVLFGLGANVGEPLRQLAAAVERLGEVTEVVAVSGVYRTEPVGYAEQPDFYNLVLVARSDAAADELLAHAIRIEREMGRERTFRNAPRLIDIDLLDWSGGAVDTPELTLPHPRLAQRAFVLVPLAEVAPEWRHPTLRQSAAELLRALDEPERVVRMGDLMGQERRSMGDVVTVPVEVGSGSSRAYEVRIGHGALRELPRLLPRLCPAHRYILIADDRVAGLHAGAVEAYLREAGLRVDRFTFPAGEANKSRESWAALSDAMFAADVGRDAAVLALGGGVTGDLAGFVAATYMRGLPLVQLPTSLLAMIDSSVGGKTGVDTPAGKNLIGAFLQPAVVLADTDTLRTLPEIETRAGMVEAVKHGAIADAAYFEFIARELPRLLELDPDATTELVRRSVEIKARVVAMDEREGGPRKMLNFGHTVGHAVEALSGFRLLHGEAIAIGMVVEARIGEAMGITEPGTAERLRGLLQRLEMPVDPPAEMAPQAILAATRSDKKARQGKVEYSLIERIGAASEAGGRWSWAVEDVVVADALSPASPSSARRNSDAAPSGLPR